MIPLMNPFVLLVYFFVSGIICGDFINNLGSDLLVQVSFTAKLPPHQIDIEDLNESQRIIDFFKKNDVISEKFLDAALNEIKKQKEEIKMYRNEMNKKMEKFEEFEEKIKRILSKNLQNFELENIKKWILRCKFFEPNCKSKVSTFFSTNFSSSIKRLQVDPDLLTKLSNSVKVNRWPRNLTVAHFIRGFFEVEEAKNQIIEIIKKLENFERDEEMKIRIELIEKLSKRDENIPITPAEFLKRLKTFDKIVDVLFHQLQHKNVPLTEDEMELVRKWLILHQVTYEVDGITECGGFINNPINPINPINLINPIGSDQIKYLKLSTKPTLTEEEDKDYAKRLSELYPKLRKEKENLFSIGKRIKSSATTMIMKPKGFFSNFSFQGEKELKKKEIKSTESQIASIKES